MVVEVANAMPVKRSVKAIPNNIPCFLFILIEMFSLFVKKTLHVKNRKAFIYLCHTCNNSVV